jgi:hypothetical protein
MVDLRAMASATEIQPIWKVIRYSSEVALRRKLTDRIFTVDSQISHYTILLVS